MKAKVNGACKSKLKSKRRLFVTSTPKGNNLSKSKSNSKMRIKLLKRSRKRKQSMVGTKTKYLTHNVLEINNSSSVAQSSVADDDGGPSTSSICRSLDKNTMKRAKFRKFRDKSHKEMINKKPSGARKTSGVQLANAASKTEEIVTEDIQIAATLIKDHDDDDDCVCIDQEPVLITIDDENPYISGPDAHGLTSTPKTTNSDVSIVGFIPSPNFFIDRTPMPWYETNKSRNLLKKTEGSNELKTPRSFGNDVIVIRDDSSVSSSLNSCSKIKTRKKVILHRKRKLRKECISNFINTEKLPQITLDLTTAGEKLPHARAMPVVPVDLTPQQPKNKVPLISIVGETPPSSSKAMDYIPLMSSDVENPMPIIVDLVTPKIKNQRNPLFTASERKQLIAYNNNAYNPNAKDNNEVQSKKRMVVIDGSNVAYHHSLNREFSVKGLKICLDFFEKIGHEVKAVVPQFRLQHSKSSDPDELRKLHAQGKIVFTPCKQLPGRSSSSYDDRFVLQLAAELDAAIVSNDCYRDLILENTAFKKIIENRVIGYSWCNDIFILPKDPYGKWGPSLDDILNR